MRRREFLRNGLLGTAGLLPGANLVTFGSNTPRESTTSAIPKTDNGFEVIVRCFYRAERKRINTSCTRTSYRCQIDPPEKIPLIWVAAVREDWNTFKRCLDEAPWLIHEKGSICITDKFYGGRPWYCKDLSLIHAVATWSDGGRALRYAISCGDDANSCSRSGCTPLHFAARWSPKLETLKILIANSANVHARNLAGKTPLGYARSEEVKRYLLERMEGSTKGETK